MSSLPPSPPSPAAAFLLYGFWVRTTGKRPGAAEPSAAAGRRTSANSFVPSRMTIGTSLVVFTPGYCAGPGSRLFGARLARVAAEVGAGAHRTASAHSAAPASRRPPCDPAIATRILALRSPRGGDSTRGGAALLEHAADLLDGVGDRLLHALHVPAGEGDEAHVRRGGDRRGAQRTLEQADLPEEVARAQVGHVLPAARHLGGALLDRHEFVGELALLDERGAGPDLALLGEGRNRGQLLVGHGLEQLDGLQALGFHSGDPIRPERGRASPPPR